MNIEHQAHIDAVACFQSQVGCQAYSKKVLAAGMRNFLSVTISYHLVLRETWKMPRLIPFCCWPPTVSIFVALLATNRLAAAIASTSEEYFYVSRANLELARRLYVALELCSELPGHGVDVEAARELGQRFRACRFRLGFHFSHSSFSISILMSAIAQSLRWCFQLSGLFGAGNPKAESCRNTCIGRLDTHRILL